METVPSVAASANRGAPCHRRLVTAIGLASVLVADVVSAIPRLKESWIKLTSPNFTFYSNSGRQVTESLARDMESLRSVLGQISKSEIRSPVPSHIYVFRNGDSFENYTPNHEGATKRIAGYFVSEPYGNYISINAESPEDSRSIIYHEFIHHYLKDNFPDLPLWFNEGFAEYYSSFSIYGDRIDVGQPVTRHVRWLEKHQLIPLERLFSIGHGSPEYNESSRAGVFYAQSWALVHYLLLGDPDREGQVFKFLGLMINGMEQDEAFRQAFATEYSQLEKELKQYLRRDFLPYRYFKLELDPGKSFKVEKMGTVEMLLRLGELQTHVYGRQESATEHYQAVIEIDPENSSALAGLGYLAIRAKRYQEAVGYYTRALRDKSGDLSSLHVFALGLLYEEATRLLKNGELEPAIQILEGLVLILAEDDPRLEPIQSLLDQARRHWEDARAPGTVGGGPEG